MINLHNLEDAERNSIVGVGFELKRSYTITKYTKKNDLIIYPSLNAN